ncbi:hypothetical protein VIBNISFn27_740011 [Vibrio nigripulchritudo SFn27]|uniref:Uncharacterized protein n=1 Tax=Vibrio nigripulchritudo TaxID=28173 RepID=U4KBC1_9VIBR|nr:hypothetical protein VIBNIBLFn1_1060096 [Vibrio nigripulchritudo BLFn1]CCN90543.1 hypothetical protein VIBNISFn27_740011 [Vibrio nigripulchritudo SFn27]CCN93519.1 hypothetical protein VIBNIENn2_230096 [Vibrio nigripulchritudo ENn2]CCO41817.1 hypothetical protein VIBNISFn135_620010 [Vibrio nigripulchritudo SFn135]CCO52070.1 hypothetical protein VIBNIWn13_210095 [Vibrio nigripulchritudo Wn13]CCO60077.1 hypothetical protein VIBNI_B0253 [Vibrio nigripulchritudo]
MTQKLKIVKKIKSSLIQLDILNHQKLTINIIINKHSFTETLSLL